MRTLLGSTLAFSALLAATVARGTTFVVPPGPGTPVQDAIDAASPGDTIRLTAGTYPEHLFIAKGIKLRGVRSTSVEPNRTTKVGGGCGLGPTIQIIADGAQLRGILVLGDSQGGVDLRGDHIKLTDLTVLSQCANVGAP